MDGFRVWMEAEEAAGGGRRTPEQVAEEFYEYQGGRFPGCLVGIAAAGQDKPGSGNCSWTARRFINWARARSRQSPGSYGEAKLIMFPASESEPAGHIVPVYDGHILDFIQAFTGGRKYLITPVRNLAGGQHSTAEGGLAGVYSMYPTYVVGDSLEEINGHFSRIIGHPGARIGPFERPRRELGYQMQPWQRGAGA